MDEIDNILKTVNELAKKDCIFVVNLLVPVDRKGIKQSLVFEEYYNFLDKNPEEIELYNHVILDHSLDNISSKSLRKVFLLILMIAMVLIL
jgi:hypothetical protein